MSELTSPTITWLVASLFLLGLFILGLFILGLVALAAFRRGGRRTAQVLGVVHAAELEMLNNVIHNSQALIAVRDLHGVYLFTNTLFDSTTKSFADSLIGQTAEVWRNEELLEIARVSDAAAMKGPYRYVAFLDLPEGRVYFESVKFPLHDARGKVYAIGSVARDITAQKEAITAVADARDAALAATAAKSTFLATMSHEIRTPMNAVIGMTDLLLDTELDELQREFAMTIHSSGDALLGVINDILDFSKIESGELQLGHEPFAVRGTVESCLDLIAVAAAAKGLDLVCYVDDSCPEDVVGDATRLRQIILNLLSNAVKFTAQGEVLLTVTGEPGPGARLTITATVSDTGIGIPARALDRLFTSFTQVDASHTRVYGGTGLGLAISQRLARAMDGDVTVSSVPDVGSTFTASVVLDPCLGEDQRPLSYSGASPVLAGSAALVVDDNPTNLRILELQLSSMGLTCHLAESGAAALALADAGLTCDVAVLDLNMPELNGIELAARLRGHGGLSGCPFILLTSEGADSRPADRGKLFAAIVTKPVKGAALRDVVTRVVRGREADPSAAVREVKGRGVGAPPATGPLRILLAEDNLVNQRVAQLMLDKLGHRVDTVGDGRAAVEAIELGDFDVVLMDVQMPQLDGLQATRLIRTRTAPQRQPYIIAMTAGALLEDREACAAAGMEGYLTKPVRGEELRSALDLARPRSASTGTAEPGEARPSGGVVASSSPPAHRG